MRRFLIGLTVLLGLMVSPAYCQYTTVTANVQDPTGQLYTNGSYNISFYDPGTSGQLPLLNGNTFQKTYSGQVIDSFGNIAPINLPDNNAIASSSGATGTQWIFSICSQPYAQYNGKTYCFGYQATITGGSVDLSAALKAVAATLPTNFPGGAVSVNNTPVTSPNFQTSTTVGFSVSGSNIQATANPALNNPASPSGSVQINSSGLFGAGPQVSTVAIKPLVGSSVQFVTTAAQGGNDSNDGLSMGSPKQYILTAYDALPTRGGTIYIMGDPAGAVVSCSAVAGQGMQGAGSTDPNYASLPGDWRKMKPVNFIGILPNTYSQQGHFLMTSIGCGGAVEPAFAVSSTQTGGQNWYLEGLLINYPHIGFQLGVDSNGNQTSASGVVGFQAKNFNIGICNSCSSSYGPGILLAGGDTFDIYLNNFVVQGNPNATAGSDNQAAILKKPTGSGGQQSVGYTFISDGVVVNGGIKSYGGNTTLDNLYVSNVYSESITAPGGGMGTLWFTGTHIQEGTAINVTTADNSGTVADVLDDISAAEPASYIGVIGSNVVTGPANLLGVNEFEAPMTTTPIAQAQTGFVNGRSYGFSDDAVRSFSPAAVRFPNLATTIASSWTTSGTGPTLTTGITAPDGGTGAGQISSTGQASMRFFDGGHAVAVGDTFIAKVAVRSQTANGYVGATPLINNLSNTYTCKSLAAPISDNTEWEWLYEYCIATTVTTNPEPDIVIGVYSDGTHTAQAYGPVFNYIASGTISTNEIAAYVNALKPYAKSCAVATICGMDTSNLVASSLTLASTLVASLPSAAASAGKSQVVSDSTAISAEGQTCVGSSTGTALAFSNGTVWKCF